MWTDIALGEPPMLIGKGTWENSNLPKSTATLVSGSADVIMIAGDIRRGYTIAQRLGTTLERVDHLMGANNRPLLQRGFVMYGRTGGAVTASNSIRLLVL